ncbi:xanthine dehydrogenase family protein molybdopterin-binding subunit [Altererythrobacter sp. SALINAS58]|uniref:xanthine dehydrogenase family protein molybdopterin-binding subunit n=1 Tax=Alteripontixanthobacter muriae TaxID=2705546 RepID=UPI0015763B9A|nr:xanthine dehydrogenase family protein molybdopterin-binding subunit [Alteripontixanthobacter muriae]
MKLSRRGVLVGAAAGGGLLLAWGLMPREYGSPLPTGPDETAFGAWLTIARDGIVTVAVPQLEMGQGVTTILPQIVAGELGADWRQVAAEPVPPSGAYANIPLAAEWAPLWMPAFPGLAGEPDNLIAQRYARASSFTATAAGTTLAAYELPAREAAATARALLAMAAAERWDIPWEECRVENGFVLHQNQRAAFGELAAEAALLVPPDPPPLRPEAMQERPFAGAAGAPLDFPRLDLPAKVSGQFLFAGDVRLPGMVHAAIRHGPQGGAELLRFDEGAASTVAGMIGVVRGQHWLAAVAENWWAAERAIDAMQPVFAVANPVDSVAVEVALDEALRSGSATRVAERVTDSGLELVEGDAFAEPDIALRYDVAPALHVPLETASATARLADGRLELWVSSQVPEQTREAAARAIGISSRDVILYPMPAGGSFDARLQTGHAVEAALIARATRRPVQLTWSRWQETLASPPRAPSAALMTARVAPDGTITALRSRIAMPPTMRETGRRVFSGESASEAAAEDTGLFGLQADPLAVDGAIPPYAIPAVAVDHAPVAIGLPTNRMRGGPHGYTCFFTESFIDEIADRRGREPLSYRIAMLGNDVRLVECLQRAARLGEWGGGEGRSGQGLACHRMGDDGLTSSAGRIACIATARRAAGGIEVSRMVAAVDIGRIVNLDIARQQVEGGLIYGLSLALGAAVRYENGLPVQGTLASLSLPRLAQSPEILVDFIASDAPPADPGELGVAVAAPAIANALYSATGVRHRRLPLLSEVT